MKSYQTNRSDLPENTTSSSSSSSSQHYPNENNNSQSSLSSSSSSSNNARKFCDPLYFSDVTSIVDILHRLTEIQPKPLLKKVQAGENPDNFKYILNEGVTIEELAQQFPVDNFGDTYLAAEINSAINSSRKGLLYKDYTDEQNNTRISTPIQFICPNSVDFRGSPLPTKFVSAMEFDQRFNEVTYNVALANLLLSAVFLDQNRIQKNNKTSKEQLLNLPPRLVNLTLPKDDAGNRILFPCGFDTVHERMSKFVELPNNAAESLIKMLFIDKFAYLKKLNEVKNSVPADILDEVEKDILAYEAERLALKVDLDQLEKNLDNEELKFNRVAARAPQAFSKYPHHAYTPRSTVTQNIQNVENNISSSTGVMGFFNMLGLTMYTLGIALPAIPFILYHGHRAKGRLPYRKTIEEFRQVADVNGALTTRHQKAEAPIAHNIKRSKIKTYSNEMDPRNLIDIEEVQGFINHRRETVKTTLDNINRVVSNVSTSQYTLYARRPDQPTYPLEGQRVTVLRIEDAQEVDNVGSQPIVSSPTPAITDLDDEFKAEETYIPPRNSL